MNLTRAAPLRIPASDPDAPVAFHHALTGREPVAAGDHEQRLPSGDSQGLSNAKPRYATIKVDGLGIGPLRFHEPVGERTNGGANRPGSMRRDRGLRTGPNPDTLN
ncbi:hypothetical protein RND61_10005 [Streptomyces sp. TRM76323]|uniref:Glyoxalase-like domain-containing protein n=1 Tax=Streptomyces tamarix TaxID=3078565 RepID=A0ABU3QI15_9ACTN|nr:hypothetical protein [Streptomyces tamarix]MDT9682398.1 hypothetical protein [Streptomyces tamarix]